jgi:hypothetical protein
MFATHIHKVESKIHCMWGGLALGPGFALLRYCVIALLHYCVIALLRYCVIALLRYCENYWITAQP